VARLRILQGVATLPESLTVLKTPGHTYDSLTLFASTHDGVVGICGDVLWWEGDEQSNVYAESLEDLRTSRSLVLARSDLVIPGHGPRFASRK
jgi:glyoxylase-like metal-dependent hydrolase (beta-lactamase superfamily II)